MSISKEVYEVLDKYKIKNLTRLSEMLVETAGSHYQGKNLKSIKSFVSQVMGGRRMLSFDMKESISLSIQIKNIELDRKAIEEDWMIALAPIYKKAQFDKKVKNGTLKRDEDGTGNKYNFSVMTKNYRVAKNILTITFEPDAIKNNPAAYYLRDMLFKKIGIISSDDTTVGQCVFIVPKLENSFNIVIRFWEGLLYHGLNRDIPNIEKKLLAANTGDNPLVQLFFVEDDDYLIHATRVLMDEGFPTEIGFATTYYTPEDLKEQIGVLRINPDRLHLAWDFARFIKQKPMTPFTFQEALDVMELQTV